MVAVALQAFSEFKNRLELSGSFQEKITTPHNVIRKRIESYDPTIKTKQK